MTDFINTIDALGDDAVMDSIINRTIVEFKDNRVETIGYYAFMNCKSLETIDLPNATNIGERAFSGCDNLKSVNLPKVKNRIGSSYGAFFENCKNLEKLVLPLTYTGTYGFANSGLKFVDLCAPKDIWLCVYTFHGCADLETLIIRSTTFPMYNNDGSIGSSGLVNNGGYIYVPKALIEEYKTATNFCNYAEHYRAIEDYPEICGG